MVQKSNDKYDFCYYVSRLTLPVEISIPNIVIMYRSSVINLQISPNVILTRYLGANRITFFNFSKEMIIYSIK